MNTNNRGLSKNRVEAIARDIKAGQWDVNESLTAPIIINSNGVLANGQHRLSAIVKAGVTVSAWVVAGMTPGTRMDNVRARSMGDNLRIQGTKAYNQVAAVARVSVIYASGLVKTSPTQEEMRKAIQGLNLDLVSQQVGRVGAPYRLSSVFAVWALARVGNPVSADDFLDQYVSGANLAEGSPVLALRNRFSRDPSARINGCTPFNLVASAWNAFIEHRTLSKIQSNPSGYDEVKGAPRDVIAAMIQAAK